MIARAWGGRVPLEHAEAFHTHLIRTGLADYGDHAGCCDIKLLRRDADGWTQFLLISLWTSMDAIRAFAGDTPEVAVLYPGDDAYGLVPDLFVTHYEVLSLEGPNVA
jgi:heme-degrading monooxygenase HmoA